VKKVKRSYIRDKRSPQPKSEAVSKVMSANKAKNTAPEIRLRQALWGAGIRGYRLHYKKIPGKPDMAFVSKKTAIFVHGCFWHRCPNCSYELPKTNSAFWQSKFEKNIVRDKRKSKDIESLGWNVLTVWECEIEKDIQKIVVSVKKLLR
jgi:DNA mismatch endonuclease (patch repair protein)